MATQSIVKRTFALVPRPVRQMLGRVPFVHGLWNNVKSNSLFHDVFYTASYYEEDVMPPASAAAEKLAASLIRRFSPRSVLDVGCGTGEYLFQIARTGVPASGLELASFALQACRAKGLRVQSCDLRRVKKLPVRADLVYSFEVAEHLPESCADRFVLLLAEAAERYVVITAALPGQGGLQHFNCQPKEYWRDRFQARGLRYEAETVTEWQAENLAADLPHWFSKNLLVFSRAG